ncbi:MAG: chain length determinant protein EpsF [Methylococcaceae bacterium]|jgi:chain length determinant protein EpsF
MNITQLMTILWYRKKIALYALLLTISTAFLVSVLSTKQFVASSSVVIDQRADDPLTGLPIQPQLLASYIATQVDIIGSHHVARKVVEKLKLDSNGKIREAYIKSGSQGDIVDLAADLISKYLEIKPARESSLIEISYSDEDPDFAALMANSFADAYIQTTVELRAQPAKLNADWFDTQILALRERLEKAQAKLSVFQQQSGIVGADDKLDIENERLADLSKQLLESQARSDEFKSKTGNIKDINSSDSLQEVLNNPLIQSLKSELAKREANFAEMTRRLDKNHPQYKQSEIEIATLRSKIDSEIKMIRKSMVNSFESSKQLDTILINALAEQKAKVLELRKQHDEIAVLSHEVENEQKAFDSAMQRTLQVRMESEFSHTNISILNKAYPPVKPAKPKKLLNMIISVFMGGILGMGAAIFAEILDRRVRSKQDLTEVLELPVFGVVSASTANAKLKHSMCRT